MFRLAAPGGAHLLIRRHAAPELALWLPARLAPQTGEPFGLYLHADRHHAARLHAAGNLRRVFGTGRPLRATRHPGADRLAAMLCVYDLKQAGASLRDIADQLVSPEPADWGSSSVRSDLRRLADASATMVDHDYRSLLRPPVSALMPRHQ